MPPSSRSRAVTRLEGFTTPTVPTSIDATALGRGRRQRLIDGSPVTQEHHAIGPRGERGVVSDDHGRDPVVTRGEDHPHDRLAVERVQGAGWLISEQQAALAHDGPRDGDALTFPTRELIAEVLRPVGESELLECLHRRHSRLLHLDAVELEGHGNVLDGGQASKQIEVLEHVAHCPAPQTCLVVARHAREALARDHDLTASRLFEASRDGQQRRLTRTARPHHRDERTALNGEIDVGDRIDLGGALAVYLGHFS
jgi:hypothetical protein